LRRGGEQSSIEQYSESLPISTFSPSPLFYTLHENWSAPLEIRAVSGKQESLPVQEPNFRRLHKGYSSYPKKLVLNFHEGVRS